MIFEEKEYRYMNKKVLNMKSPTPDVQDFLSEYT